MLSFEVWKHHKYHQIYWMWMINCCCGWRKDRVLIKERANRITDTVFIQLPHTISSHSSSVSNSIARKRYLNLTNERFKFPNAPLSWWCLLNKRCSNSSFGPMLHQTTFPASNTDVFYRQGIKISSSLRLQQFSVALDQTDWFPCKQIKFELNAITFCITCPMEQLPYGFKKIFFRLLLCITDNRFLLAPPTGSCPQVNCDEMIARLVCPKMIYSNLHLSGYSLNFAGEIHN